jgi:hypothetical protein
MGRYDHMTTEQIRLGVTATAQFTKGYTLPPEAKEQAHSEINQMLDELQQRAGENQG